MLETIVVVAGESLSIAVIGAVVIVLLIGLSAFFSSSEIALFSLSQHRIESLVDEKPKRGKALKELRDSPHRSLVTILIGNNISNIAMSSITTGLLALLEFTPTQSIIIATFGITSLVLLFGESVPKSYAVENAESWALQIARPLKLFKYLLYPLVFLFDHLTRAINRVTGGHGAIETVYVTRSEIQRVIKTGERQGVLEPDEAELLRQVFDFTDTTARDVMVPRPDIVSLSQDMSIEEALEFSVESGHTKFPVFSEDMEEVIGSVHIRNLVRQYVFGDGTTELEEIVRPVLMVPESKDVDELLAEMQEKRIGLSIVVDEFGSVTGLITTEDLVEEIVGEIFRRGETPPIEKIDEYSAVVRGDVTIQEANEVLGINLPRSDRFNTVAGFILNQTGRTVEEEESVDYDGLRLTVLEMDGERVVRVRVTKNV